MQTNVITNLYAFIDTTHLLEQVRGDFILLMTGAKKLKDCTVAFDPLLAASAATSFIPSGTQHSTIPARLQAAYTHILSLTNQKTKAPMVVALRKLGEKHLTKPGKWLPKAKEALEQLAAEHRIIFFVDTDSDIPLLGYIDESLKEKVLLRRVAKRDEASLNLLILDLGLRPQHTVMVGPGGTEATWAQHLGFNYIKNTTMRDLPRMVAAKLEPKRMPAQFSLFS